MTHKRLPVCDKRHVPRFDESAAKGLDHQEVADRWPRYEPGSRCPDCGAPREPYASNEHAIAGGWI